MQTPHEVNAVVANFLDCPQRGVVKAMATVICGGMKLPEKLRILREERRLSQAKVAEKVGVHQSRISRWENGEGEPDRQQLLALARVYRVLVDYLADDELDNVPPALSATEQQALDLIRALNLSKDAVIQGLTASARTAAQGTAKEPVIEVNPADRLRPVDPPRPQPGSSPPKRQPKTG